MYKFLAEASNQPIYFYCLGILKVVNFPFHSFPVDTEKTVWVLVNLLSNALRYSPEHNKVIVKASIIDSSVEFSVKDFGVGIEDKYKDRLFKRYFQVPGSQRNGTILGLAISKEFIEDQNGKIGVESKVGEGAGLILL